MLIYCPDCKAQISNDVDKCPKCGCNIEGYKNSDYIFEQAIPKHYNGFSIASAVMGLVSPVFIYISTFMLLMGSIVRTYISVIGILLLVCYLATIYFFAIRSLIKDPSAYKWPSVIGIIIASIFTMLLLLALFLTVFVYR